MRKILIPSLLVWLALMASCSIYRPTIQQGNILSMKQIDKLKPGMSKRQVLFVMGTPLLEDPFHKNRWDYVHTVKSGKTSITTIQRLSLYFNKDGLARIDKSAIQESVLQN